MRFNFVNSFVSKHSQQEFVASEAVSRKTTIHSACAENQRRLYAVFFHEARLENKDEFSHDTTSSRTW